MDDQPRPFKLKDLLLFGAKRNRKSNYRKLGVMVGWKKLLLIAAGFGVGFALTVASIVGGWAWYESRRTKPKPWNAKAIVATFDYPETESGEPEGSVGFRPYVLVIYYTLENKTDLDYTMPPQEQLDIDARLKRQDSLTGGSDLATIDKERVFIPAKQRRRFALHLHYPMKETFGPDSPSTDEERRHKSTLIEAYMRKEYTNLDGFVVYDSINRYQVNLPKGW